MTLIPDEQNLFVVDLHYVVPLDEIEPHIDAHMAFLEENYASGRFIVSGPKVPRTGGVIVATAPNLDFLENLLEADPFKTEGLAQYRITEFRASMKARQLES